MSQASAVEQRQVVRMRLRVRDSSRRSLEERLAIRLPSLAAVVFRLILLLPLRSRIRRAMLRHTVEQGVEAYNRHDYEALRPTYHPEVQLISEPEAVALGFDPIYRGWEGWLRYQQRWHSEWGDYRAEPEELIDLGDGRLLAIGQQVGTGSGSGAATTNDWADLFTVSAGRVIREQPFFNRHEAFKAAGLEA